MNYIEPIFPIKIFMIFPGTNESHHSEVC